MKASESIRAALAALQDAQDQLARALGEIETAAVTGAPASTPARPLLVCVDAGHGGQDPGAVAADGATEKELALAYASFLQAELTRRGHRVTMTRTGDTFLPPVERARKADSVGADCLISLHANAAESKLANGAWVIHDDITKPGPAGGQALAESIFRALAKVPGAADADSAPEVFPDRSPAVGGRNLAVLSTQRAVAVLVELGFLTNEDDLSQLRSEVARRQLCAAIADGVEGWAAAR